MKRALGDVPRRTQSRIRSGSAKRLCSRSIFGLVASTHLVDRRCPCGVASGIASISASSETRSSAVCRRLRGMKKTGPTHAIPSSPRWRRKAQTGRGPSSSLRRHEYSGHTFATCTTVPVNQTTTAVCGFNSRWRSWRPKCAAFRWHQYQVTWVICTNVVSDESKPRLLSVSVSSISRIIMPFKMYLRHLTVKSRIATTLRGWRHVRIEVS